MKPEYYAAAVFIVAGIVLMFFTVPASATINITTPDVGATYILWEWNANLTLTDMFIDSQQMCGYETTNNTYLLTDLNPGELHTIVLFTAGDTGTNSTTTNATGYSSGNNGGTALAPPDIPLPAAVPIAAVGALLMLRRL